MKQLFNSLLSFCLATAMFTACDDEQEVTKNVAIENGAIKAAFSVSNSKQVYFSQGNLQYQASTGTWRFAEHQYDIIGNNNSNISSSYSGWIDLFGWGTSGYNGKEAYMTSTDYSDYGDGSNDIAGTNYDWGVYNKISNGGNQAGQWRTLTNSEWDYVIFGRAQAGHLMGQGRVNNVIGLILLPEGWETPSTVKFTYAPGNYSTNVYSLLTSGQKCSRTVLCFCLLRATVTARIYPTLVPSASIGQVRLTTTIRCTVCTSATTS